MLLSTRHVTDYRGVKRIPIENVWLLVQQLMPGLCTSHKEGHIVCAAVKADYPAIHSILFIFCVCMYGYGFLSRGFTDRREILHSGRATSQAGLLFWGYSFRDGQVLGINSGHVVGYASC